jgi:8-oxo-dGTP pyrophosphatase MutT (NUDIX family)
MLESKDVFAKLRQYRCNQNGARPGFFTPAALHRGDHDLNPDFTPQVEKLTEAAIVVPLIQRPTGLYVLLTERSRHLRNHPGQVGFPGGRKDPEDKDALATALRELQEEIAVDATQVTILTCLDTYITRTGFEITPVVAELSPDIQPVPDPQEVEEVFEVPLQFFLEPKNRKVESRFYGGKDRFFYAFNHDGHYIWGVSAGIVINLIEALLGPIEKPETAISGDD